MSYVISGFLVYYIYQNITISKFETLINTSAIIVTLGSALIGLSAIFISDFQNRIFSDIEILFNELLKIKKWERWAFLNRKKVIKLINGTSLNLGIINPIIPFNLGFNKINISVPSSLEDIYDLPFLFTLLIMHRQKEQFYIYISKDKSLLNEYTTYQCIIDILTLVLKCRLTKILLHIGSGLVIFSILFLIFYLFSYYN